MNDVLLIFLSLSVSGSILALILLAIKPLIKNRLSQTWQYYIWLIVILRFLLPFTPEVSVVGEMSRHIQNISTPPAVVETDPGIGANEEYTIPQAPDVPPIPQAPALQSVETETPVQPVLWSDILNNIWLLWLGVALVLFVHKIASYRSFARFVKVGMKTLTDTHIWDIYQSELAAARIKRQLPLYENNLVVSPMLVGIARPALVIPALGANDDELRNILRHELTHYKRLDFLYKWIVQITLCLHWFNPLVYLISKQINKSCELSCDEAVIKHLDEDGRITYGDALIASLKKQGTYSDFVVSMTMSENGNIVKERLDMIMSYKKKSRLIICLSSILTVLLICGFTFTGAYAATQQNNVDISPINQPKQQVTSASQPEQTIGNTSGQTNSATQPQQIVDSRLNLVEKEYTIAELEAKNIQGIVITGLSEDGEKITGVLSENVIIKSGGDTLKLQYYQMSDGEYSFDDTITDGGGTRNNILIGRTTSNVSNEPNRTIIVTIPDNANIKTLSVYTGSGDISIENCSTVLLKTKSVSGNIIINDCAVSYNLNTQTVSGNIDVIALSTDTTSKYDFEANITSDSGKVLFQPKDNVSNYHFIFATNPKNAITVNGRSYTGGDFVLNENVPKTVHISSGYMYAEDKGKSDGLGTASFTINNN